MLPEGERSTTKGNRARTIIDAHIKGEKTKEMELPTQVGSERENGESPEQRPVSLTACELCQDKRENV